MGFEYDPHKSESNKIKHGIDFEFAKELWLDDKRLEIRLDSSSEVRYVMIANLETKFWTVVFTYREEKIRLISVRRSRKKEIELYDNS